jgi:hypothetical protein
MAIISQNIHNQLSSYDVLYAQYPELVPNGSFIATQQVAQVTDPLTSIECNYSFNEVTDLPLDLSARVAELGHAAVLTLSRKTVGFYEIKFVDLSTQPSAEIPKRCLLQVLLDGEQYRPGQCINYNSQGVASELNSDWQVLLLLPALEAVVSNRSAISHALKTVKRAQLLDHKIAETTNAPNDLKKLKEYKQGLKFK